MADNEYRGERRSDEGRGGRSERWGSGGGRSSSGREGARQRDDRGAGRERFERTSSRDDARPDERGGERREGRQDRFFYDEPRQERRDDNRGGRFERGGDERRSYGNRGDRRDSGGSRGFGDRDTRGGSGDRGGRRFDDSNGERRGGFGRSERDGERRQFDRGDRPRFEGRDERGDRPRFGRGDDRAGRQRFGDERGESRSFDGRDDRRGYGERPVRYGERGRFERAERGGFDRDSQRDERRGESRGFGDRGERRGFGGRDERGGERRFGRSEPGGFDRRDDRRGGGRDFRGGERRFDRDSRDGDDRRSDRPATPGDAGIRGPRSWDRKTDDHGRKEPRALEPTLPEDITGRELDRGVRQQLRTLTKENADGVAKHLVAAAELLEADPEKALAHAQHAVSRAGRVPAAREALGLVLYRNGDFAEALREFRTARRLSGSDHLLPYMVDCERGLGRHERALELANSPEAARLSEADNIELAIVVSGVRRDMGQARAAVVGLRIPALTKATTQPWAARLFYAYADALLDLGERDEAREWFVKADAADADGETDAQDRIDELDGFQLTDLAPEDEQDLDPQFAQYDLSKPFGEAPAVGDAASAADEASFDDASAVGDQGDEDKGRRD